MVWHRRLFFLFVVPVCVAGQAHASSAPCESPNEVTTLPPKRYAQIDAIIHAAAANRATANKETTIGALDSLVGSCIPTNSIVHMPPDPFDSLIKKDIDATLEHLTPVNEAGEISIKNPQVDAPKIYQIGESRLSDIQIYDIAATARSLFAEVATSDQLNNPAQRRFYTRTAAKVILNRKETPLGCRERQDFENPKNRLSKDIRSEFVILTTDPAQFNCWMPSSKEAHRYAPNGGRNYAPASQRSAVNPAFQYAMCPPELVTVEKPRRGKKTGAPIPVTAKKLIERFHEAWHVSLEAAVDAVLHPELLHREFPEVTERYYTSGAKRKHMQATANKNYNKTILQLWDDKNEESYRFCTNQIKN